MASLEGLSWADITDVGHKSYECGHCGGQTSVKHGFRTSDGKNQIYICGGCNQPTFFHNEGRQVPAPILGNEVEKLPNDVKALYTEARRCTQVESYTACVLTCRKILMHVAVQKDAKPNESFFYYVKYLAKEGYVPPDGRGWVDHIRSKGNEANHEIVVMDKEEAFQLLSFAEMLLKFVYEFPARIVPPSTED